MLPIFCKKISEMKIQEYHTPCAPKDLNLQTHTQQPNWDEDVQIKQTSTDLILYFIDEREYLALQDVGTNGRSRMYNKKVERNISHHLYYSVSPILKRMEDVFCI